MADVKISALPAATAATGGDIPVVQSSTTKKLSMSAAGATIAEAANAAAQRTALALAAVAASGSATDLSAGTVAAARMPALTGDVTTSAGAVATTIAAAAVTLAKQANLAANSIQGNNTGSAATPLALTIAQVAAMLAGAGYTTLTPPVRSMPLNIDVPEVADYTLDFALPAGCVFVSLTVLIDSGTSVTASVKINSTAITGISGVTINTGSQVFTATAAKTGVLNDHIKFSISAVSGSPVKLRGSLWYIETAA